MTAYPDRAPLPSYQVADDRWNGENGNLGLWYDKYCDRWAPGFEKLYDVEAERKEHGRIVKEASDGGRIEWLRKALAPVGNSALLTASAERQKAFARKREGICFRAQTIKKFATGLGRAHPVQNGFEWHYTLGVPVLRASGQKGMVREWAANWMGLTETDLTPVLGATRLPLSRGSVDFLPALPIAPCELCIDGTTPHLTEYYQDGKDPADWYDPKPLQWLAVKPGAVFQFALVPAKTAQAGDVHTAGRWLLEALETIGAGAGTAADRGLFKRVSGWHCDAALRSPI